MSDNADMGQGFIQVGPNMTIQNETKIENIESKIEEAMNQENMENQTISADLKDFSLVDNNEGYLLVSHSALNNAVLGKVGKAEYNTSKDKSSLLRGIVNDSLARVANEGKQTINFTGSFVEPKIEKKTNFEYPPCECTHPENCHKWVSTGNFGEKYICNECGTGEACLVPQEAIDWVHGKKAFQEFIPPFEKPVEAKKSWLTADLEVPTDVEVEASESLDTISIKQDMPLARQSDHLAQEMQAEAHAITAEQDKIKENAANAVVLMLNAMGYGSAKVAEVVLSENKVDVMTTLDDSGTTKAVNIPVAIKESSIIFPKKSLVSELISKGLDVNAKLSNDFALEVLARIDEVEAREKYYTDEVQAILDERPNTVTKEASSQPQTQYLGDNEVIHVNKHMIPDLDLNEGDQVHMDGVTYRLVSKHTDQLDKNADGASTWTFEKVYPSAEKDTKKEVKY